MSTPRASKPGLAAPAWRSTRTNDAPSTTSRTLQAIWPTTNALRRRDRAEDDRTPSLSDVPASTFDPLRAGSTPKTTAAPMDNDTAKSNTRQSTVSGTTIGVVSGGSILVARAVIARARPMPTRPLKAKSTIVSVSS